MRFDAERFENFLSLLPKDTREAEALAHRHDDRLNGRSWLKSEADMPVRHAFEIRHTSFCSPEFIALLRRYGAALVCADTVEWPLLMDLTSDFVYCRLHGSQQLYVSGYDSDDLDIWAERIRAWVAGREPQNANRVMPRTRPKAGGRDVYVYFDNDAKVRAPFDAISLAEKLGMPETAAA
jgi:uncharacterized protein YecE (DUF72 family)